MFKPNFINNKNRIVKDLIQILIFVSEKLFEIKFYLKKK